MSNIFSEALSVNFQVSTIQKTNNCFGMKGQKKLHHIFLSKFLKVLVELFFKVPLSGCSRSTLANKNMFKFDENKEQEYMLYK